MNKISDFDVEELVRGMHALDDEVDIYDFVVDEYSMDWDDFYKLISNLLPLAIVGQSPLTGKVYRGFGKNNMFFIKQEVEEE